MRNRITPAALALCLILALLSMGAQAAETGAEWGKEVTWSYDENTKTLTISGAGPMPDGAPPCDDLYRVETVIIGDGITTIGAGSFENCSNLKKVTIPASVTSIGERAFFCCSRLSGVAIPGDNITVGKDAFYGCGSLTSVMFSGRVSSIGEEAFSSCGGLTSIAFSGSVAAIGDRAFSSCGLTGVTIPGDNVTVGEQAFYSCGSLTGVRFSGAAVKIGNEAFRSCGKLTRLELQKGAASIGESAFSFCEDLIGIAIQGDVGTIGDSAFSFCEDLTSVAIQGDVGIIEASAFYYCRALTSVAFSGGIAAIGETAFDMCQRLAKVTIGGDVGSIGESAFFRCEDLAAVDISGKVDSIGKSAFTNLNNLTDFHVGGTLSSIGYNAFAYCAGLTAFPTVEGGMTGPIGESAFAYCGGLHRILLPEGVTSVGKDAFSMGDLTAIWIPASVTEIDRFAFPQELYDLYYEGTEAQWKAVKGYQNVVDDGLPVIHYNCGRKLPDTAAGDSETLRRLIHDGIGSGRVEIQLTQDISLGGDPLVIEDNCNVLLDLKGHKLTFAAEPAVTVVGSLTVTDSTEKSPPAIGADNRVCYDCTGVIEKSGGASGEVIDVQFGGSFTLLGGTVRGGGPDTAAIMVTGPRTAEENEDGISTTVNIQGGYVEANGPAVRASGETQINVRGGVVLSSQGEAVLLGVREDTWRGPGVSMQGGAVIHQSSQFSCGIYLPRKGSVFFHGGRILVENGVGILMRGGSVHVSSGVNPKEITAGGSGTGTLGGSMVALPAGKKIVLDQKSGFCGLGRFNLYCDFVPTSLIEQYAPEGIPVDGYELKREDSRYFFGPRVSYQITFDSNGGTPVTPGTMETDSSGRITAFPSDPTRTGYVFRGWSTTPDRIGYGLNIGYTLEKDTTLYALWTPVGTYIIEFRYHYELSSNTVAYKLTDTNGVLADWPDLKVSDGTLLGWFTDSGGGEEYSPDHVFTGDTVVWGRFPPNAPPPYDITFDFSGAGGTMVTKQTDDKGKLADWPADPTREGYVFMGWGRSRGSSIPVGKGDTFFSSQTLYANWMPEGGYAVRFSLNEDGAGAVFETRHTNLHARLERWPDTPVRPGTGRIFSGWYTSPTGGSRLAADHRFYGDAVLYAHWLQRDSAPAGSYVITFDPNGGTGGSVLITERNGRLAFLPYNDPVLARHTFDGWFTGKADGTRVSTATVFTADTTVYAHWTANGDLPGPGDPTTFTVTFHLNYTGAPAGTVVTASKGGKVARPTAPARAGYTFGGWYREAGCTSPWNFDTDTVTGDMILYAKWTPAPAAWTVTLDPRSGTLPPGQSAAVTTGQDGRLASMPGNPTRDGYAFSGWFTEETGGTRVSTATVFTADTTIYAHWTKDGGGDPEEPKNFIIIFDPNGGSGGGSLTTGTDGRLTSLPEDPIRIGYAFDGWFTGRTGGTRVSTATVFAENTTVYACWSKDTGPAARYWIYCPDRVPGGSLYVSHTSAAEGTRVTVEASPRGGYELDWLAVTNLDTGREVRLTGHYRDEYSFVMPAADVEVELAFIARSGGGGGNTGSTAPLPKPAPASAKPIRWYYSSGAIYHVTSGLVPPGTWLTRDMLISVLYNLDTTSTGEPEFWATEHKVIPDIYRSWLWGVDKPVNREQAAMLLFSYATYKNYNTFERVSLTGYTDHSLVSPTAQSAMSWARASGLITGISARILAPKGDLTCGQGGVILSRFVGDGARTG